MNPLSSPKTVLTALLAMLVSPIAAAGDVTIVAADFRQSGGDQWSVAVTLQHGDSGWQHYADGWRLVDGSGAVLGMRVLHHPHVNEQPFTRSLSGVAIPAPIVYIEAHDKVHGWTPSRVKIDLNQAVDGRLTVKTR